MSISHFEEQGNTYFKRESLTTRRISMVLAKDIHITATGIKSVALRLQLIL